MGNIPDRNEFIDTIDRGRRRALATLIGVGLSGCSSSPLLSSATDALRLAVEGFPDVPITAKQVADLPYASVGVKIGNGPRSLLVLSQRQGDDLQWISADRVALVTRRGRLIQSAGLPQNLQHTKPVGNDPLAEGVHRVAEGTAFMRLIDVMPGFTFSAPLHSTFHPEAEETIEILGRRYATRRVREECVAPDLNWKFENLYWADLGSGFVWRSQQYLTPDTPEIRIEVFKPAA